MTIWTVSQEPFLRLAFFVLVFAVIALWEVIARRRELGQPRARRWCANLGLAALDSVLVRLVFPTAAVGVAVIADVSGWGLFQQIELSAGLTAVLSVLLLDLTIYVQHRMFHAFPILWRLHRVHHSDQDLDLTSGIRFHPVEILMSMVIKVGAVVVLGTPPFAVFLFEVLLNATSVFNHGNVRLWPGLDQWLRWAVVTPDMHRVHHSVVPDEHHSNFGFNLPWWDRLFGTYRAQPRAGHEGMQLGIAELRRERERGLLDLLRLPFERSPRSPQRQSRGDRADI